MRVRYVYDYHPRSDGRPGKPTGVTIGKEYEVAEILSVKDQYSIINDDNKIARYSRKRFIVTKRTPVKNLRASFNMLTLPMRQEIKRLQQLVSDNNLE